MSTETSAITIDWPRQANEHGRPMLWFGSWLVGANGDEAGWFYSGRGGERAAYPVPGEATGIRIRRWPNEGFDAEYADVLALAEAADLSPAALDFDTRQRYSLLDAAFR
ncbi:MAG: hypothetical protein ACR2HN_06735 [Tepidiformaceae bacterium]